MYKVEVSETHWKKLSLSQMTIKILFGEVMAQSIYVYFLICLLINEGHYFHTLCILNYSIESKINEFEKIYSITKLYLKMMGKI